MTISKQENEITLNIGSAEVTEQTDYSCRDKIDYDKDKLSSKQREKNPSLSKQFPQVFNKTDGEFGCKNILKHKIYLIDDTPIRLLDRTIPHYLLSEIQTILQYWVG